MAARSGIRGKSLAIVLLGIAIILVAVSKAAAVFPPLYQTPTAPTQPTQPPQQTQSVDPPVIVTGEPEIVDPVDAQTPEPATLIAGLMGLMAAGGYAWRKRQK